MRRQARTIIYVCSAIKDNILISEMIEAVSTEAAISNFEEDFKIKPQTILGPFFKKKSITLVKNFDIKFKPGINKKGIYNGWEITAMPLSSPINSAYIFYDKRIDGNKMQKPTSNVVKLEEIQEIK